MTLPIPNDKPADLPTSEAAILPVATDSSPAKKRKRPSASAKKAGTAPKDVPAVGANSATLPPTKTLIIDNGGDTVKYGWNTDATPQCMANVTARLPQQWTVLVGDQLRTIHNPSQLIGVTRSTERGIIVNLGNQIQVWKRILDLLGVAVPLNSDTAQVFNWKKTAASAAITPSACAVLIALPLFCPRSVLDAIAQIWFDDFGSGHVGFCVSTHVARQEHFDYKTCLTVDLGWSATTIVPSIGNSILKRGCRRIPLGGRHLINMMKYYFSYRQWNLMEQEWILRDVLEKAGFVSCNFKHDMQLGRKLVKGRRPFDREYVLPDYQHTFIGSIRLPAPLLRSQLELEMADESNDDDDDDDSSVDQADLMEEDIKEDDNDEEIRPAEETRKVNDDDSDDLAGEEDDKEETLDQVRARVLKQREAEEKRRRELEQEQQVLHLSVERFVVPECLFRPSDAALPTEMAGLSQAIVQAIKACEEVYQPALYRSIHLVGGLCRLEGLMARLLQDLQSLAPCQYPVTITVAERPLEQAWTGATQLSNEPFAEWSISRASWETSKTKGSWKHFIDNGQLV